MVNFNQVNVHELLLMLPMPIVYGSQYSNNVITMLETLKDYVNSETGSVV